MINFIVRRLAMLVLMFVLVSMLIFAARPILPGDVDTMVLGRFASEEAKAALRANSGLTARWLSSTAIGWATSCRATGAPPSACRAESALIVERTSSTRLPCLRRPDHVRAAGHPLWDAGRPATRLLDGQRHCRSAALAFIGLPKLSLGLVLISVFAIQTGWLSASAIIPSSTTFFEILPMLISARDHSGADEPRLRHPHDARQHCRGHEDGLRADGEAQGPAARTACSPVTSYATPSADGDGRSR